MILSKLTLHDYGVYGGLHEITLAPPTPRTPIVLFDGLNGTGKTTFLDAIQLCLFGPVANCSNRGNNSYHEFLKKSINRNSEWQQASVGLEFSHVVGGEKLNYRLRRTWKVENNRIFETFDVDRNGRLLASSNERWLQHIEEIIPANIANLFFFDGEEAEQYALHNSSQEILKTGIYNLLGLDVVDRLIQDLQTLEKKTLKEQPSTNIKKNIQGLDLVIVDLEKEKKSLSNKRDLLQETFETYKKYVKNAESRFLKAGGDLYEKRNELEKTASDAAIDRLDAEQELQKLAEGSLPLALAHNLLGAILLRDKSEQKIMKARRSAVILCELSTDLLFTLKEKKIDKKVISLIKHEFENRISQFRQQATQQAMEPIDDVTRFSIKHLSKNVLPATVLDAKDKIEIYKKTTLAMDIAIEEIKSVPDTIAVRKIFKEKHTLQTELCSIEEKLKETIEKIAQIDRNLERNNKLVNHVLSTITESKIAGKDKTRLVEHSNEARKILALFRAQIIDKHRETIEHLVLESFQSLLRKQALIEKISICSESFSITLFDKDNRRLPAERLSAGERQLFAISLLWGLAKASGRPLPIAIDTPLGRLDTIHRKHLVSRYFPFASHQVMLFSTDQEIQGDYLKALKPNIGRYYQLLHCDKTGCTNVIQRPLS